MYVGRVFDQNVTNDDTRAFCQELLLNSPEHAGRGARNPAAIDD